jgi:lysophospholipase L1-like esterase
MVTLLLGSSIMEKWKPQKIYPVFNCGLGRLTTNLLKDYFELLPDIKASVVLFYCGANDLIYTSIDPKTTVNNINVFLEAVNKKYMGATIYVLSLIRSPKMYHLGHIDAIDYINKRLEKTKHTHFLSINDVLNDPRDFLKDRHHLSRIGYAKLEKYVLDKMKMK